MAKKIILIIWIFLFQLSLHSQVARIPNLYIYQPTISDTVGNYCYLSLKNSSTQIKQFLKRTTLNRLEKLLNKEKVKSFILIFEDYSDNYKTEIKMLTLDKDSNYALYKVVLNYRKDKIIIRKDKMVIDSAKYAGILRSYSLPARDPCKTNYRDAGVTWLLCFELINTESYKIIYDRLRME